MNSIDYMHAVLACIIGVVIYWLAVPLSWVGLFIAIASTGAVIRVGQLSRTGIRGILLACLLFHIAGFAVIAYLSAEKAYSYYGDFHSGITDANYANALLRPWSAIPHLGLFFTEGKIVKGVIDFIRPPTGEDESRDNAVEAIIVLGVISRVIAFVIFFLIVRSFNASPHAIFAALLIFSFQYTNIALTQSMKFVAGLPFFMLWFWSFLEYERVGKKRWLVVHGATLIPLFISEQWIIFFLAVFYLMHPFFRLIAEGGVRGFDLLGAMGIAIASSVLYVIEWGRITHNQLPFLPLVPSGFRSTYFYEYPAILLFFGISCAIGFFLHHYTESFTGKKLITFGIIPLAIFTQSLAFLHPSFFLLKDTLIFFLPYWLLISFALSMIIRTAFIEGKISDVSRIALLAWTIGSLPQWFLIAGISMPTSPVLDVFIVPLLVLAASSRKNKIFTVFLIIITLVALLSIYKFITYTGGWGRIAICIPIILAPIALNMIRKRRYA